MNPSMPAAFVNELSNREGNGRSSFESETHAGTVENRSINVFRYLSSRGRNGTPFPMHRSSEYDDSEKAVRNSVIIKGEVL